MPRVRWCVGRVPAAWETGGGADHRPGSLGHTLPFKGSFLSRTRALACDLFLPREPAEGNINVFERMCVVGILKLTPAHLL